MQLQVKCGVTNNNFTECERREMSNHFNFEVLHVPWREPQRKREGLELGAPINSVSAEI